MSPALAPTAANDPACESAARAWWRAALVVVSLIVLAAAWRSLDPSTLDPERIAEFFAPYRSNWLSFPAVLAVFVVAEMFLFPVLVLIFVCGIAFGPVLGSLYALAGSLASAVAAFWLGRRIGREPLERVGGAVVRKLEHVLDRRGLLAVFLVRKVPAPYTLVNLVCGAAPLSLRDFVLGTLLGMGPGVLVITLLGAQLLDIVRDPSPGRVAVALALLFGPLVFVFALQRRFNRKLEGEP